MNQKMNQKNKKNNKKIWIIVAIVAIVVAILNMIPMVYVAYHVWFRYMFDFGNEDPRYDARFDWMMAKPVNKGDPALAEECIKDMEERYGTGFHVLGYAYMYHSNTGERELSTIYVYSDDYPQVVCSYDLLKNYDDDPTDRYPLEVSAWERKNMLYDIAEESGLDIKLMAFGVSWSDDENILTGDMYANEKISEEDIRLLFEKIKEKMEVDKISFDVYRTQRGTNRRFKQEMRGLGFISNESSMENHLGNWKKYIVEADTSGIRMELKWEQTR